MSMIKPVWAFLFLFFVFVYVQLFLIQDKLPVTKEVKLSHTMPTEVFQIAGHTYLEQMLADILFIKVAVYYGGGHDIEKSIDSMAQHFQTMNILNPKMVDFYYRTEAALADKGDDYARITNQILEQGRKALPNDVTLPYFEGFNYFYYLDEPLKGAELLRLASTYDKKYEWLGHLASTLEAQGGNIRAGLIWLKGMHASMHEGEEKERYAKDIQDYELALIVQAAIDAFNTKYGEYPKNLDVLIPDFLNLLPEVSAKFDLVYEPPLLFLRVNVRQ